MAPITNCCASICLQDLCSSSLCGDKTKPTVAPFFAAYEACMYLPTISSFPTLPNKLLWCELDQIRQNTAYMACFICRKILPSHCDICRAALLSNNVTDIHAYITAKDVCNHLL